MSKLTHLAVALALAAAPAALAQTCPQGNGLYVLYYGSDVTGGDGLRIRNAQPNYVVVASGMEARSDIPAFYHAGGVKALAYIAQGYGGNNVDNNIRTAMNAGYDGVFFDETNSSAHAYNAHCHQLVKSFGQDKLVFVNPGTLPSDLGVFNHADIVSVENQWNAALPGNFPAWRWLAIQGDPGGWAPATLQEAKSRLEAFRNHGGFWYYTGGPAHWQIPSWFEQFAADVRAGPAPCGPPPPPPEPPQITALFLAEPDGTAPTNDIRPGGTYDLVLRAEDPGGFSSLIFADVWWSAPGVSEGTLTNRGGRYLPGENYVVSTSLADSHLWAQETADSDQGWTDVTGKDGVYVDGRTFQVNASAKEARFRLRLPSGAAGTWSVDGYVQRAPFNGGVKSALFEGTFAIQEADAGTEAPDAGSPDAGSSSTDAGTVTGTDAGTSNGSKRPASRPDAGSSSTPEPGGCSSAGGGLLTAAWVAGSLWLVVRPSRRRRAR